MMEEIVSSPSPHCSLVGVHKCKQMQLGPRSPNAPPHRPCRSEQHFLFVTYSSYNSRSQAGWALVAVATLNGSERGRGGGGEA